MSSYDKYYGKYYKNKTEPEDQRVMEQSVIKGQHL